MARKDLDRPEDFEAQLTIPVVVRGYNESGAPFSECTQTVTVSANGCLIVLATPVRNEQLLLVTNVKTEEEILCHVARRAKSENGLARVKVGFVSPAERFWELTFASEGRDPASGGRE
ncbi:MAG: hypothetical protein LAO19_17655 [Acidobacteriia bacterium]|nr:hypothetical protein [Terriglobia bacterium]